MDQSAVVPKKCILKVDIHCNECEREIKRALSKVDGVYSVSVDGKAGMVTVTGKMNPYKVIKALKKKGKQAMMVQYEDEDAVPLENQRQPTSQQGMITAQMSHPHHFSKMDKLKQVEFTHSKSLRIMTFQSHQNGGVGSSCWVASGFSHPPAMNYTNTNQYSCTTPRGDMSLPSSCSIPPRAPRQQRNHLIPNANVPTSPYLNSFADHLPTNCNLM